MTYIDVMLLAKNKKVRYFVGAAVVGAVIYLLNTKGHNDFGDVAQNIVCRAKPNNEYSDKLELYVKERYKKIDGLTLNDIGEPGKACIKMCKVGGETTVIEMLDILRKW